MREVRASGADTQVTADPRNWAPSAALSRAGGAFEALTHGVTPDWSRKDYLGSVKASQMKLMHVISVDNILHKAPSSRHFYAAGGGGAREWS